MNRPEPLGAICIAAGGAVSFVSAFPPFLVQHAGPYTSSGSLLTPLLNVPSGRFGGLLAAAYAVLFVLILAAQVTMMLTGVVVLRSGVRPGRVRLSLALAVLLLILTAVADLGGATVAQYGWPYVTPLPDIGQALFVAGLIAVIVGARIVLHAPAATATVATEHAQ